MVCYCLVWDPFLLLLGLDTHVLSHANPKVCATTQRRPCAHLRGSHDLEIKLDFFFTLGKQWGQGWGGAIMFQLDSDVIQ